MSAVVIAVVISALLVGQFGQASYEAESMIQGDRGRARYRYEIETHTNIPYIYVCIPLGIHFLVDTKM